MAPSPFGSGVEVVIDGGDDLGSDRDDPRLVALAEDTEAGGPFGDLDRSDLHGDGFADAYAGPGEHRE